MDLSAWLTQSGISATTFGRLVGYTQPNSIYRVIRGDRRPSPETAEEIARATNGAVTMLDHDAAYLRRKRKGATSA